MTLIDTTPTVAQALQQAQRLGLERLDAQLLLLYALGRGQHERAWLLAHDTDAVMPLELAAFETQVQRRLQGEPVAYLLGQKEFFGLTLAVDQRVLVPRPDTETLVDWALEVLADKVGATVIDLGTGSGAIALALKHRRPDLHVSALDASMQALEVARANAQRLQLDVDLRLGSWLEGTSQRFDAIVSNPPYIALHDPHLPALAHEPVQALTSGADGLDDLRVIITQAPDHLNPGGWLLLEHGYDQASNVRDLLCEAGLVNARSRCDLSGIERCSAAQLPSF